MQITSDNPEHGFQFPGIFELNAMGAANRGLEDDLQRVLAEAGIRVVSDSLSVRASRAGNYVSVRLSFHAEDRAQYDAAHELLRRHPEVKWTL